jgi:hypothetical protein
MAGLVDGHLWGQLAWVDTLDGSTDPPVQAGNLTQDNSGGVMAAVTPILTVPQGDQITVHTTVYCNTLTIGQHNDSDVLLGWPSGSMQLIALDPGIVYHNATHGTWSVHVEDDLGNVHDFPVGNLPYNTAHPVDFVIHGTDCEVFFDSVSLGHVTIRSPATLDEWVVSWYIDATQATNTWRTSALTISENRP